MLYLGLTLLVGCGNPISGTYLTTQITDWAGTCDTTGLGAAGDTSAVNVEVDAESMTFSDSGGDYPCELSGDVFSCVLIDEEQDAGNNTVVGSYLEIVGVWTSSSSFDSTFYFAITCEGADCTLADVEDCVSEADYSGELD